MNRINPIRSANRAFTLIELLVVIAIIAILAAILFPVFAQAREKARQASCLSNEKQIGTALMMYAQDYDESLPRAFSGGTVTDPGRDWATDLIPYVKAGGVADAAQVAASASDPNLYKTRPDLFTANQPFYQCPSKGESRDVLKRGFRRGYGYNNWLTLSTGSIALSDLSTPAEHLAFGEVFGEVDRLAPFNWPTDSRFRPEARHNNGLNVGYCDGHAKWVKGTDTRMQWPAGMASGNSYPVGTYFWPQAAP